MSVHNIIHTPLQTNNIDELGIVLRNVAVYKFIGGQPEGTPQEQWLNFSWFYVTTKFIAA